MKDFEFKRFGRVLRRDILENRTKTLRAFASLYLANLAVIGFNLYGPSRDGLNGFMPGSDFAEKMLLSKVAAFVLMLFAFVFYFSVSQTFSNLRTKQMRIASLMLPATNLEKYLSRLLQSTLGYAVAFFAAFVLADLTRMLLFPLLGHSFGSLVPYLTESLFNGFPWTVSQLNETDYGIVGWWWLALGVSYVLWLLSYYLLGSAVFRRRAFLYSLLVLIGAFIAFGLGVDFIHHTMNLRIRFTAHAVPYVACVLTALACFNVWLSYRLFKRIQVIPRKLFSR